MLTMLVLAWAPLLAAGGGAFYLGLRWVRAVERRNATNAELAELRERMLRLEEGVADIATDVTRIAEGQQFTTRVLAGRRGEGESPAGGG